MSLRIGIACYPTYGGSGVLATELGLALADSGHRIDLFSYARPQRLAAFHEGIEFHNVTVSSYPLFQYPPYDLALASSMRSVMEQGLDILHVHYAVPHALCAYLARRMAGPDCATRIVTTLHGTDITILGRDPSYREVIRFGLEQSDAVISVSEWLADETRAVFDYDGPIDIIPNFVDTERFSPPPTPCNRKQLAPDGAPLIVHMSNFRELKRAHETLDVLDRIDHPDAVLVLAGDGPELSPIRDEASRRGLCDRVRFLGEIAEVTPILACCDVALFPSESESFGLAALEAMSCGLPVVATRVGGVPEVVVEGETGFLHDVGDTESMAASVQKLLADRDLCTSMGERAAALAHERFSLASSLQQHEAIYERVLAAPIRQP